jgi:hypothetical protein
MLTSAIWILISPLYSMNLRSLNLFMKKLHARARHPHHDISLTAAVCCVLHTARYGHDQSLQRRPSYFTTVMRPKAPPMFGATDGFLGGCQ